MKSRREFLGWFFLLLSLPFLSVAVEHLIKERLKDSEFLVDQEVKINSGPYRGLQGYIYRGSWDPVFGWKYLVDVNNHSEVFSENELELVDE